MSLEAVLNRPANVRDLVEVEKSISRYTPLEVWNLSPEEWGSVEGYLSENRRFPEITSHYVIDISIVDPQSPLLAKYSDLVTPALSRKCRNDSDFSRSNIPYPYADYAAALQILGKVTPSPKTDLLDSVLMGMPKLLQSSTALITDVLSSTAIILGRSDFHGLSRRQQEEIISGIFSKGVSMAAMEEAAKLRIAGFDLSRITMEKDLVRLAEEFFKWAKTLTFQDSPLDKGQIYQVAAAKLLAADNVGFVGGKLHITMDSPKVSAITPPMPERRRFT